MKPAATYKEIMENTYDGIDGYECSFYGIYPSKINDDGSINFIFVEENQVEYIMSGKTKRWRKA